MGAGGDAPPPHGAARAATCRHRASRGPWTTWRGGHVWWQTHEERHLPSLRKGGLRGILRLTPHAIGSQNRNIITWNRFPRRTQRYRWGVASRTQPPHPVFTQNTPEWCTRAIIGEPQSSTNVFLSSTATVWVWKRSFEVPGPDALQSSWLEASRESWLQVSWSLVRSLEDSAQESLDRRCPGTRVTQRTCSPAWRGVGSSVVKSKPTSES